MVEARIAVTTDDSVQSEKLWTLEVELSSMTEVLVVAQIATRAA